MKLAFVSDFYYPSIGGTQVLCKGLAEWFRDQGHDIEIITSPDSNREDLGYVVHEISGADISKSKEVREGKYDAIFVFADLTSNSLLFDYSSTNSNSILIFNLDENVYQWVHNGLIKDLSKRLESIRSFRNTVSYCLNAPVNKFLEENNIPYIFIPNFSRDMNSINSTKIKKEKLGITKKIIFNHSAIETRKNQLNLIKCFKSSDLVEEYDLVLLGSPRGGPNELEYLKKCMKERTENIHFLKGTNSEEIISSMLKMSDIFIMPSVAEGLPLCILEAMSADLPWVSTPCGGVPKILGNLGCGIVLNNFNLDSRELSDSIRKASSLKSSREVWLSNFTIDIIMSKYKELL